MVVEGVCDEMDDLWITLNDQTEVSMPLYGDYTGILSMRSDVFVAVRIMAEQIRETMGIRPNMGLTQRSARYETI